MTEDQIVAGIAYHIDKYCTGGDDNDWPCAEAIKREFVDPLLKAAQTVYDRHADYMPMGSWKRPGHDVIQREWDDLRDALLALTPALGRQEP